MRQVKAYRNAMVSLKIIPFPNLSRSITRSSMVSAMLTPAYQSVTTDKIAKTNKRNENRYLFILQAEWLPGRKVPAREFNS
jgi:hypothetical protein